MAVQTVCRGFYSGLQFQLKTIFKEGADSELLQAAETLTRRLVQSLGTSPLEKAKKVVAYNQLAAQLRAQNKAVSYQQKILAMYEDFDHLCFSMSKADGVINVSQIKEMTAYDFMRHKQLLAKRIERRKIKQ